MQGNANPNEWLTTDYVNDINAGNAQVLTEHTGDKTTFYEYGAERIAAYEKEWLAERKTEYVYDGRGSVAQEVSYNNAWYNYLLPMTQDTQVKSHRYTPFGTQMTDKTSGYGFNAEEYSAKTGQQYLRMRYYDPGMMRFSQKDMVQMQGAGSIGLNRYAYAANNPTNFSDPSGMFFKEIGNFFNNVGKAIVKGVQTVGRAIVNTVQTVGRAIVRGVQAIGNAIVNTARAVGNAIVSGVQAVGSAIYNAGQSIYNGAKKVYNEAKAGVKAAVEYQKAVQRQETVDAIGEAFPGAATCERDGKIGVEVNGQVAWCNTAEEVKKLASCLDGGKLKDQIVYTTKEAAVAAFAQDAIPKTDYSNSEQMTVIGKVKIEKIVDGEIVKAEGYKKAPTLSNNMHNTVWPVLMQTYIASIFIPGEDISYVHTHPNCNCHVREHFSKEDKDVAKLPGVENMYLVTPSGQIKVTDGEREMEVDVSGEYIPEMKIQHIDPKYAWEQD
ncbi:MAG: RHS repeat-associated core domain-containing protein [Solibacillus sp.]